MNMRRTLTRTTAALALAGATFAIPAAANAATLVYYGTTSTGKYMYTNVDTGGFVFTNKFLGDVVETCEP